MRTPGALNKPKFCNVSLAALCGTLNPNTLIPIDIKFAAALGLSGQPVAAVVNTVANAVVKAPVQPESSVEKIEFTILNP